MLPSSCQPREPVLTHSTERERKHCIVRYNSDSDINMAAADEIEDDFAPVGITPNATSRFSTITTTGTTSKSNRPRSTTNLDRNPNNASKKSGVTQPTPQALPKRHGPSSIIVSPRQKGNPILSALKSMPWEYGDIPADYLLGLTTCALFLSLKYHKLHPEYIYNRIKQLQGKYALRIVLVMVDIDDHDKPLRELSKTSLINNVTLVLCWSAAEGGRYLELFKTYENAAPTSIKQHQSNSYSDRLVDFVTTPRSINKTDAVALVSQFGTIRTAVNARHEDIATIAGWGEKKVQRWCASVREPFRIQRAAKRTLARDDTLPSLSQPISRAGTLSRDVTRGENEDAAESRLQEASGLSLQDTDADKRPKSRMAEEIPVNDSLFVHDDEESLDEAMTAKPAPPKTTTDSMQVTSKKRKPEDDPLNDGVMAALSKLRKDG